MQKPIILESSWKCANGLLLDTWHGHRQLT